MSLRALPPEKLDRAEELERMQFRGIVLTKDQLAELAVLKDEARALQYPPESEVAAAYLKAMQDKCREEFEAFLENQALKYGKEFLPLLLEAIPALLKSVK